MRIVKVTDKNIEGVLDFLRTDILRHVFAYYDIQYKPEHTSMYVAFNEEASIEAYLLVYTALRFPSVILEGEAPAVERLLAQAPKNAMIIHAEPHLLGVVKKKFPEAKVYVENWMLVKKDEARFFDSPLVRRLEVEDATKLLHLLSTREDRVPESKEKYEEMIRSMPVYGVFLNNETLVSYAASFLQLPEVWMIGGVYTHPKSRGKGYATLAVSAITKHALGSAKAAALFVRSDNYPAIKVYEKIGYRKVGEKLWIDVNTGLKP
jgi:RimJ/RimL family protein N-acetyltransferase